MFHRLATDIPASAKTPNVSPSFEAMVGLKTYGIVRQSPLCDFASLQYRIVNETHHTLM